MAEAQIKDNLNAFINFGHYPVGIATPTFNQLHTGIQLGLVHTYNDSEKHSINQSLAVGFLHHADFQNAALLTSELFYRFTSASGFSLSPLVLGGGYTYSMLDQETFVWSEEEEAYVKDNWPTENNWHITLGASLGYLFGNERKYRIVFDYRMMVQGIIVKNTVPVIVYSPIKLGFEIPLGSN